MKKILFPSMALAAIVSLASCSSDEPAGPSTAGDGVSVTLKLPAGMITRGSFGDGSGEGDRATIDNLQYTVYEIDADGTPRYILDNTISNPVFTQVDNNMATTTVNLNLAKGHTYKLAFYADNAGDKFVTYNGETGALSVDYAQGASNVVNEDCFVGTSTEITVDGVVNTSVMLNRPFAQLNWGSDDINDPILKNIINDLKGTVTVSSGLYNTYNVLTGAYDGEVTSPVSFPAVPVKNDLSQTFPVEHSDALKQYRLIAMNYLLTGDGTINCSLNFGTTLPEVSVSAAPVKPNYRTNIYGSLLTSPANFEIMLDYNFAGDNPVLISVPVETAQDFMTAVQNGMSPIIPAGVSIDIKDQPNVELENGQTLLVNGTLNTARAQISISGAGNVAYVEGSGKITSVGVEGATGNRPLNVYNGATLIVKNISIETEQNNGGSVIYSEDGNIDLENVTINCHNFAIGASGGTLKVKNCNITSDSNNMEGAWSYTINVSQGCVATIDESTVTGIQGGISVGNEGSIATINGGTYQTVKIDGKGTPHYPVYIFDKGVVVVNSGNFISAHSMNYTIYNGNNDVPEQYTWGNGCELKGGLYNGPTLNQENQTAYPAAKGYKWISIDGPAPFKYEVVKE